MTLRPLLALLVTLAGCASSPAPRAWLDPATAATITAQSTPTVLARDEQMRAINVRDYAQLAAIEVNRMGERELYLVVLLWSTIDRSALEQEKLATAFTRIEIQADDRPIALTRLPAMLRPEGVGARPFALPTPGAQEAYFPIRRDALRSIAQSRTLSLTTQGSPGAPFQYSEWRDGRASLTHFLSQLPQWPE